jgi:hypothetical protein
MYTVEHRMTYTFMHIMRSDVIVKMILKTIDDVLTSDTVVIRWGNVPSLVSRMVAKWKEMCFEYKEGNMDEDDDENKGGLYSSETCTSTAEKEAMFDTCHWGDYSSQTSGVAQTSEVAKISDVSLQVKELIDFCDEILGLK